MPAHFGFTACLKQGTDRVWLYLLRGIAYTEEAKRFARSARGAPNPSAELLEYIENRFKAAEDDYRTASKLNTGPSAVPELHYALLVNRGFISIEHENLDAAMADLEAAIAQYPERYEAYTGLAHILERKGQTDLALKKLTTAIELKPKQAALHRSRANTLLGIGGMAADLHDVNLRELIKNALALSADRLALAQLDLEDAILYETAATAPRAFDKAKQAVLFHAIGEHHEALRACDEALELSPKLAFAHQLRMNVLLNLGEYPRLIEACDRALESIKPTAEIYYSRALAKDRLEKHTDAVADYILALEREPNNDRLHRRLAWSYLADDALLFAIDHFNKSIEIQPSDADAFSGRGIALAFCGKYEEAASDAARSLELGEQSWRIEFNAACVYSQAALAAVKAARDNRSAELRLASRYLRSARDLAAKAIERARRISEAL